MSKRKVDVVESDEEEVSSTGNDFSENDKENRNIDDRDALTPYEAGIILRIYCEDFMCHRKFSIDLGKRVNFITGQNGSGKSAIVAAIQLCLGATARNTGRGTNLGNLILEGSDGPAIVRVTLLNEGHDAYKKDIYGDRITIERQIQKKGGGGYRILDSRGSIVSKEKQELESILRTFEIFVENPCCVLTQEESKKFIQGHEKDKYEFFLKATGLQRTAEEIEIVKRSIDDSVITQQSTKDKLILKRKGVDRLQQEMKEFDSLVEIEDKINDCVVKNIWCEVRKVEEDLWEINNAKEKQMKKINNLTNELAAIQSKEEELGDMDVLQSELETVQKEQEELGNVLTELQRDFLSKQRHLSVINSDIQTLRNSRSDNTSRLNSVRAQLKELSEKALANAEVGRERQVLEQMEQSRRHQFDVFRKDEEDLRQKRSNQSEEISRHQQLLQQYQGQLRSLNHNLSQLRQQKQSCGNDNSNKAGLFGRNLPQILRSIQSTRFQERVIGPVGMHLKLRDGTLFDGRIGMPVEKCLGNSFGWFIVSNMEDRNTLTKILKSLNAEREHRIIIQQAVPRYDVPKIPDAVTVMDALVIEEDQVFNMLVDQMRIDQMVIAEDEAAISRKFVVNQNGADGFRNGIIVAYTLDCTSIKYRYGNRASEVSRDNVYRRLLSADMTEIKAQLDSQIAVEEKNIEELNALTNEQQALLQTCHRQLGEIDKRLKELNALKSRESRRQQELKEELSDIQSLLSFDSGPLEEEAKDLQDAIDDVNRQIADKESEFQAAKEAVEESKNMKKNEEKRRDRLVDRVRAAEEKLQALVNEQELLRDEMKAKAKQIESLQKVLNDMEAAEKELAKKVKDKTDEANGQCLQLIPTWANERPELSPRDNKEQLDKKLRELKARLESARRKAGLTGRTKAQVLNALQSAIADYEEHKKQYKHVINVIEELTIDCNERQARWEEQREKCSESIRQQFDTYLQAKGGSGTLNINHEEKSLNIELYTDNQDQHTQCTDVRQLSGGERSFTTLCLLLALGHVIESPFRILDEYDVFLDQHTRELTLQQIQDYALNAEQRGKQFIIVTPQDLKGIITTRNEVRIHRMARPQRLSAHGLVQSTL